jgi:putative redox protein
VTSARQLARAVGSSGWSAPPYRTDLSVGSHELVADEPIAGGGGDLGPTPFGLLASALAACTAITLRMYAVRKGFEVEQIDVDVRYDIADDHTLSISRTISIPRDLTTEQRDSLAYITERTPVTLAIRGGTAITTRFTQANA